MSVTVRGIEPRARITTISSRRPVAGARDDMVAVIVYRVGTDPVRRWGLVQRVGPVWSATLGLDPVTAIQRAIAIARPEGTHAPAPAGGPDAGS